MTPQKLFDSGRLVIAVLKADDMEWRASGLSKVEKIGIRGHDCKSIRLAYSQMRSSAVNRASPVVKT